MMNNVKYTSCNYMLRYIAVLPLVSVGIKLYQVWTIHLSSIIIIYKITLTKT